MDLSTSCSTHCRVTPNARMTLNAICMILIYFHFHALYWSQLDSGFGVLSSCQFWYSQDIYGHANH